MPSSLTTATRQNDDFQDFVANNRQIFVRYLRGKIGGKQLDPEDALQESLAKIWRAWPSWPNDDEQRMRYARRILSCAAVDAIRSEYGRTGARANVYLEAGDADSPWPVDKMHNQALGLLSDICGDPATNPEIIERGRLAVLGSALSPFEAEILFRVALLKESYGDVAKKLKVSTARVSDTYSETRQFLRGLIEHSQATRMGADEKTQLYDLLDGKLTGRRKRLARRHLDNCVLCQEHAAAEERLTSRGAAIILPLPALFFGGKSLAGLAVAKFAGKVGLTVGKKVVIGAVAVVAAVTPTVVVLANHESKPRSVEVSSVSPVKRQVTKVLKGTVNLPKASSHRHSTAVPPKPVPPPVAPASSQSSQSPPSTSRPPPAPTADHTEVTKNKVVLTPKSK